MTTDLCRIVVYCESDFHKHSPFYPRPESGAAYAFKLDLIVLLIPEYRVDVNGRKIKVVENDNVKIEKEGIHLEIDISDLVADLIDHESMHMILYHLEGYSVSEKLESLDSLDDFRLLKHKLHNSLWHRLLVKLHVFR
ncbi:MAG: hypothetical protein OEY95_00470 [Candidatus Bathyarchaeota archaeon]|nr:hypothetical protein [Candidatus Bathyarchaeota archaeon]